MTQTQEPVDISEEAVGKAIVNLNPVKKWLRDVDHAGVAREDLAKDLVRTGELLACLRTALTAAEARIKEIEGEPDEYDRIQELEQEACDLEGKLIAAEAKAESGFRDGIEAAAKVAFNYGGLNAQELRTLRAVAYAIRALAPSTTGQRDWAEDASLENGNYICRCVHCGETFTGHKRRVCCKSCATRPSTTGQTEHLSFSYRNWRGETAERCVQPLWLWYGSTKWHPEPQWFLKAIDAVKNEERDFALRDIQFVTGQTERELALKVAADRDAVDSEAEKPVERETLADRQWVLGEIERWVRADRQAPVTRADLIEWLMALEDSLDQERR